MFYIILGINVLTPPDNIGATTVWDLSIITNIKYVLYTTKKITPRDYICRCVLYNIVQDPIKTYRSGVRNRFLLILFVLNTEHVRSVKDYVLHPV